MTAGPLETAQAGGRNQGWGRGINWWPLPEKVWLSLSDLLRAFTWNLLCLFIIQGIVPKTLAKAFPRLQLDGKNYLHKDHYF
jgi:hypothetical protein